MDEPDSIATDLSRRWAGRGRIRHPIPRRRTDGGGPRHRLRTRACVPGSPRDAGVRPGRGRAGLRAVPPVPGRPRRSGPGSGFRDDGPRQGPVAWAWAIEHPRLARRDLATADRDSAWAAPAGTIEDVFDVTLHDFVDVRRAGCSTPLTSARSGFPTSLPGSWRRSRNWKRPPQRTAGVPRPDCRRTDQRDDAVHHRPRLRARRPRVAQPPRRGPDGRDRLPRHVRSRRCARFDQLAATSGPPVEKVRGSMAASRQPGDGQSEVNLDIDVIRAVAPEGADPGTTRPRTRVGRSGRSSTASSRTAGPTSRRSAGGRASWPARIAPMARMASSMAAAAAAGVTVYVASGDHGAYGCIDQSRQDLRVSVEPPPAGDPNVVGVGGTYMSMLDDGTYIDEVAWEEPLTGWAPGGGLSAHYLATLPGRAARGAVERPLERDAPGARRGCGGRSRQRIPDGQRGEAVVGRRDQRLRAVLGRVHCPRPPTRGRAGGCWTARRPRPDVVRGRGRPAAGLRSSTT